MINFFGSPELMAHKMVFELASVKIFKDHLL